MVGKGFSEVETPLFKGMIVAHQADEVAAGVDVDDVPATDADPTLPSPTPTTQPPPPPPPEELPSISQVIPTPPPSPIAQPSSPLRQPQRSQSTHDAKISLDLLHTLLETCTTLTRKVEALEQDKVAQALDIIKLKQRVKKLERKNKLNVFGLRRLRKVGTTQRVKSFAYTIMDDQEDASKQGEIIANIDEDEDVTLKDVADDKVEENKEKGVVTRDPEETATPSIIIHTEPKSKDKRKGIMVQEHKPLKKKTQIEQDESYARELEVELNKNINWDDVIEQVQRKEKEDNVVLRYQALKRKPQTEAQARKNMMINLRNMAGFKMDYFKGMSYDDIRPIFEKYFNSNVTFLEKTKEQLEEEESRALKRTIPNNDDDVYTEATPLALKVPVVDYEIYTGNNKPYYKIIRADGTHQLFLSFLSLLRNFNREDLEVLWLIVKERFASSKPKNFLDDFLLTTLTYMFEKPDVEERRYPLTRFTLDQMLNNVGLEVEEESEVSLELLRFIRQQQLEGFKPE
nr:hypothetical protein [Tanacetum cinerariifolium]